MRIPKNVEIAELTRYEGWQSITHLWDNIEDRSLFGTAINMLRKWGLRSVRVVMHNGEEYNVKILKE